MSQKAMVFIDGGWLYKSRTALFERLGSEGGFEIDYAKIPKLFCEDVANALDEDISLVRTYYFGAIPSSRSGFNTAKQYAFYDFLEKTCGYDTDIHEADVGPGERVDDGWLKVAMSTKMMYYATLSGACDIFIFVGDDPDFTPLIRQIRRLGKRVQIVGLKDNPLATRKHTCDFPPIALENHADKLRLVRERVKRVCRQCGREEETTWAGADFFCSECRSKFRS